MVRSLALLACFLSMVAATAPAFAADANGYTALYECRADGPNCNVDMEAYTTAACAQTITVSDTLAQIEAKLNTGADPVCVRAGDYYGKGVVTVTGDGTGGDRRVIRCATSGGAACADPWRADSAERARFRGLVLDNANFLILDRLAFEGTTSNTNVDVYRVDLKNGSSDIIFNRLLVEGRPTPGAPIYGAFGSDGNPVSQRTITQNSVIRENWGQTGRNCVGIGWQNGSDHWVVNNEIYNWCEHNFQNGENGTPTLSGHVLENNDIYYTPSFQGYSEDNVVFKMSGTQSGPMRVIHNRVWGTRWGTNTSENGGGLGIFLAGKGNSATDPHWVQVQNNIVFDNIYCIGGYPGQGGRNSIIGNICYNHHRFNSHGDGYSISPLYIGRDSEIYLNTIIDSDLSFYYGSANADIRCNAMISAGQVEGDAASGSGTQVGHNVYYGSANLGEATRVDKALATRANSTAYASGDVMRVTGGCASSSDPACFLYKATATGTSAASAPAPCAALGCTYADGGVAWQAIRGPYVFKRKLRTVPGGETMVIPYAVAHAGSFENNFCPGPRP